MVKVSVIIPVYNGEKYLEQCLDSVCHQTLEDIEILCVDDGSTDSSYSILEKYQAADQRVRLFKQQNQYAGAARNLGKAYARGEYLVFWDCDDFFELDALEKLYNRIVETEADICACGAKKYFQNKEKSYPCPDYLKKKYIPAGDVFNRLTNEKYILNFTNAAVWNKMYRRSFVEKWGIDFQAIRNGNDVYFTINAMCLAEKVTYIEDALVHYRTNQNDSLVSTLSKSVKTPIQAWIDAAENLQKNKVFPEQSFVNKCCDSMIYMLRNIRNGEAFCEAVEFLQNYGLEKLYIIEREDEFYYNPRHAEIVKHLLNDSPQVFRDYLTFWTYVQLTESVANNNLHKEKIKIYKKREKELLKEIESIKKSNSYKVGRWITYIPWKLKNLGKS